ncbi:MAG: T9SS type A sorting domain-containing protein [bacterium]|nr:T9SS type A sorting domain-containing protein [bacterium]
MKKFVSFALVCLFAVAALSFAATPDPTGKCDAMSYSTTDVFGTIVRTIPSSPPGASCAWVGMSYANGELLQFQNIASPAGVTMYRKNPNTGAVIATVVLAPLNGGYIMEAAFDGTNIWVAQWNPTGYIRQLTLAGVEVSSFPWSTGGSPRCINWDGANLWLGTNVSSNNTNLYKITTTGTILQTWATGTVVGWYMGGDWATNAPAGGQLVIADNVGNTIKRLVISGTTVTIGNQVASPAASPDVAEGLAYDGDLLIHCGAYASAGLVWFIDDGYTSGPVPMEINTSAFSPPVTIPANGGSFLYNINVHNTGTSPVSFQVWNKIRDAANNYYMVWGPISRTLPGGANPSRLLNQTVSGNLPSGTLYFISYIGTYPGSIADSSFFTITKSAVADGNPWISENYVTGNFLDEYATSTSAPTQFAVVGNYPNPFNPTTNISYSLANAGNVQLTVFDATGREVATLVNGYRDAGSHQVTFDASKLASGVYLYQLSSGSQVASGKMVLMK